MISILVDTKVQKNTVFCLMEHIKKRESLENQNDHTYKGRSFPPNLFTVQPRKILFLKYSVYLFHPEKIKVSTYVSTRHWLIYRTEYLGYYSLTLKFIHKQIDRFRNHFKASKHWSMLILITVLKSLCMSVVIFIAPGILERSVLLTVIIKHSDIFSYLFKLINLLHTLILSLFNTSIFGIYEWFLFNLSYFLLSCKFL